MNFLKGLFCWLTRHRIAISVSRVNDIVITKTRCLRCKKSGIFGLGPK